MPVVGWQPASPAQWGLYGVEAIWLRKHRVEGDLPALACDALLEGLDSPALVLLAGERRTAVQADLADLLVEALAELDLAAPPEGELAERVLRYWCWRVTTERISPLEGARAIDRLIYESGAPSAVHAFSQLVVDWYAGGLSSRAALDREIRERAVAVLALPAAGR